MSRRRCCYCGGGVAGDADDSDRHERNCVMRDDLAKAVVREIQANCTHDQQPVRYPSAYFWKCVKCGHLS